MDRATHRYLRLKKSCDLFHDTLDSHGGSLGARLRPHRDDQIRDYGKVTVSLIGVPETPSGSVATARILYVFPLTKPLFTVAV